MRAEIREWIAKDDDRRRVYETDPLYRAQARMLSDSLDAVESSLHANKVPVVAVAQAMHAATFAVLGSIEAAEARATAARGAVRQAEINVQGLRPPGHEGGWRD